MCSILMQIFFKTHANIRATVIWQFSTLLVEWNRIFFLFSEQHFFLAPSTWSRVNEGETNLNFVHASSHHRHQREYHQLGSQIGLYICKRWGLVSMVQKVSHVFDLIHRKIFYDFLINFMHLWARKLLTYYWKTGWSINFTQSIWNLLVCIK